MVTILQRPFRSVLRPGKKGCDRCSALPISRTIRRRNQICDSRGQETSRQTALNPGTGWYSYCANPRGQILLSAVPEHMDVPCGNLLVYGSLMAPEVTKLLLGRVPTTQAATLEGYCRYSVKDADYPAIIPQQGSEVHGLLVSDLTMNELQILDDYEDDDYHRATVTVHTDVDGQEHRAYVYVWNDWVRDKLDIERPWDYTDFRQNKLGQYVQMVMFYAKDVGTKTGTWLPLSLSAWKGDMHAFLGMLFFIGIRCWA